MSDHDTPFISAAVSISLPQARILKELLQHLAKQDVVTVEDVGFTAADFLALRTLVRDDSLLTGGRTSSAPLLVRADVPGARPFIARFCYEDFLVLRDIASTAACGLAEIKKAKT